MGSPFFVRAEPEELGEGCTQRPSFRGFAKIVLVSPFRMRQLVRLAFERRQFRHYGYLWEKPDPDRGGMKYEGIVLTTWSSDGQGGNHQLTFTIDGVPYSVRVDDIVEFQISIFGKVKDKSKILDYTLEYES